MSLISVALFAALTMLVSNLPARACRSNTIVAAPSKITSSMTTEISPNRYDVKMAPASGANLSLVQASNHDVVYCIDLTISSSPNLPNTQMGVIFWGNKQDTTDFYQLSLSDGQYAVFRILFGKSYVLIPWTADASIKKGIRQKLEIDLHVTVSGADFRINGVEVNSIIARPSAEAEQYGVTFASPKDGASSFQFESPRVVR